MNMQSDIRSQCSEAEWGARVDLAACYRLVDHFGWSDLLGTHISSRVPGEDDAFLINPYGLLFDEITASSLVKVDEQGNILSPTDYHINPAGFVIHSAIHMAKPEYACALHTHTQAGTAVDMNYGMGRGRVVEGGTVAAGIFTCTAGIFANRKLAHDYRIACLQHFCIRDP